MNFAKYQEDAHLFLRDMASGLGIGDMDKAARITRAVLHAVRDRIPAPDAVHLAAQLPIVWKGIYFDGFKFRPEPPHIRDARNWIGFIRSKDRFASIYDFPDDRHVLSAFDCVMRVLEQRMGEKQMRQIWKALHHEIRDSVHYAY